MHVKAKQVAILGMLAAGVTIAIIMASVIRTNTLFLLAAASFAVGIAIREFGIRMGVGFWLACVLLGVMLSPDKIYILTFGAMALYIIGNEAAYALIMKPGIKSRRIVYFITKIICFNVIYLPVIIFFPKLIYPGKVNILFVFIAVLLGQVAWFIFDKAYDYVQHKIWTKVRIKLKLNDEA